MEPIVTVLIPLSQLQALLTLVNDHINDRKPAAIELVEAQERLALAVEQTVV